MKRSNPEQFDCPVMLFSKFEINLVMRGEWDHGESRETDHTVVIEEIPWVGMDDRGSVVPNANLASKQIFAYGETRVSHRRCNLGSYLNIISFNICGGVSLRISQHLRHNKSLSGERNDLRFSKDIVIICSLLLHLCEDEVCGPIHDSFDLLDWVNRGAERGRLTSEIVSPE